MPCFIGQSDAVLDVMDIVDKVAKSPDTPVLIVGQTGTGKELIARAIHFRSASYNQPLVTVNCAAIPKDLIESELFGYEKGAFSGAVAAGKTGLVEKAGGGTLFLDEVADLNLEAQAKILRFLENGEFYRIGGTQRIIVKTRIVSATNRDLEAMAQADRFRPDLYYRLAVVKIAVPSLNARPDDIAPIARHFLKEFARKFEKTQAFLTPEAETALRARRWTGNVRELKNIIERAVLMTDQPAITPAHLGVEQGDQSWPGGEPANGFSLPPFSLHGLDLPAILDDMERYYFEQALSVAGGNESRAAQLLGMSRDTFRYRRRQHRL
jgi:transcriptional regulator with PAS, ATPase and Fis domain